MKKNISLWYNTTFQLCKKDGTVIANATTNSKGNVKFTGLYQGSYILKEIASNEKYVLNTKEIDIELNYAETKTLSNYVLTEIPQTVTLEKDKITEIVFKNELKKGQVRVIKVDLDNNEVRLAGVKFEIYDEDNNLVDKIVTDSNGEAVSKRLRIDKNYTVKESKTLPDYVLTEETQTVTLKQNQITDITFENERVKGYIQVTKTSAEDNEYSELSKGSPLADVTFEIYDSDNNKVDTIITDSTGKAVSKELIKGCYTIKEITSAKYYLLNTNTYSAEIIEDQKIVNVDITNDNVNIDVEINKKGFIETQNIYF